MKWFNNLKISVKLISAFLIVAIILGVVGLFGIYNLGKMNTSQDDMYFNNLIPVKEAYEAQVNYTRLRVQIRNLYLHDTDQQKQAELATIKETTALVDQAVDKYKATDLSVTAQKIIDSYDVEWKTYQDVYARAIEIGSSGNEAAFKGFINNELKTQGDIVFNLLKESIELSILEADQANQRGEETYNSALTITIIMVVLAFLLSIVFGIVLARMISKPLGRIVVLAKNVADGDLREKVNIDSTDEVGKLASSFNHMIDRLNGTVSGIIESSHNVAAAAEQISAATEEIAGGSTAQATAAQTIHELFSELKMAIQSVAQSTEQASELSDSAMKIAREGRTIIDDSVKSMNGVREQMSQLEQDSHQVGDIIEVIEDIADQTNLLALNAAIEAARAGEQGRGFAVVADEVRKLAERSGEATKKITVIIQGMQQNTKRSVNAVEESAALSEKTGEAFERITKMVNDTGHRVSEIAAASEEQAAQAANVLTTVENVSAAAEESAASSEESAATAQSLAQLADDLQHTVSSFKTA
ncbi:chemotaxis protein [Paenibacillus sp. BIHB 4019]|uniref:Chemotaxis protein n=1 Tax=Paenibacillus sp. BIHB 4019 TaxID=1870819 RepID=A0A1B2DCI6_9BACL|nr:methyl-accepting chemotaxis protein [Paenibacillus sp. BIHB 4019]ANY65440.1 chemotaxis protein [Paenibacillus sp. BIHB 4019]